MDDAMVPESPTLNDETTSQQEDELVQLVAHDPKSIVTLEMAQKAAKSHATVLIQGETGVGKELIARYIHQHSSCHRGPFISVNCAALPENMIESILFGYEKGSFTSAINRYIGKFEQAQNGSLMLDEISELPLNLQAKLLRSLQEREIERLGGKNQIKINARVIAATNKNLREQVESGHFRSDLYYRLNVIPIHCAPLRERLDDILPLVEFFLTKHAKNLRIQIPTLTAAAKAKLQHYSWPGNVREMDNIIQRTLIMRGESMIDEKDFQDLDDTITHSLQSKLKNMGSRLAIQEAKIIIEVLKETEGCRGIAAKKLNMSPRTLRYKISKLKSMGVKVP